MHQFAYEPSRIQRATVAAALGLGLIGAFVQQDGIDFSWGEVDKARLAQQAEHPLALFHTQSMGATAA